MIDDSESSESAQLTEPRAVPRRSAGGDRRDLDLFELRHDMAVVVPRLAPEMRIVWEWLQFDTVRRTARALRVSPMTIYQRLKRLRAALLAADLDHSCRKVETLGR